MRRPACVQQVVYQCRRHAPSPPASYPPNYTARVTQQFEARAGCYDADLSWHGPLAAAVVAAAELQPGECVLDVGCGTGLVTLAAAALVGEGGSVLGVDLSPAMLAVAKAKARAMGLQECCAFLAADIESLHTSFAAPATRDAILCSNALPFLRDIPAALTTWRSWLRPGGRVVFNTPMVRHWCRKVQKHSITGTFSLPC